MESKQIKKLMKRILNVLTMRNEITLFVLLAVVLFSFKLIDDKVFEFAYPKKNGTEIILSTDKFKKFKKEWHGSDYYYYSDQNGLICSILYYKLNDEETESLVEIPKKTVNGKGNSPIYPFIYFKNSSNLKSMEKNESSWGKAEDNFMFRQNDVGFGGSSFSQKHMYGYCMFDKDIFVTIHLSKVGCTATDSTDMRNILKSFEWKK